MNNLSHLHKVERHRAQKLGEQARKPATEKKKENWNNTPGRKDKSHRLQLLTQEAYGLILKVL